MELLADRDPEEARKILDPVLRLMMDAVHRYEGFRLAIEHFQKIVAALEGSRETERFGLSGLPYSGACANAAHCLVELGDGASARELLRRGERAVDAANHLYSRMPLAIGHGLVLLLERKATEAVRILEPAVAACRENKFAGQTMITLTVLGQAYTASGRAQEAIPLLQEAIALQEKAAAFVDRAWWVRTLGEAHRRAGQLEAAEAAAHAALEFARRHGEAAQEAWTFALLGDIAADRGHHKAATRHFEDSERHAVGLEMQPLVAYCRGRLSPHPSSDRS
jgi:tetratricopeptide (TPR) repeat protein